MVMPLAAVVSRWAGGSPAFYCLLMGLAILASVLSSALPAHAEILLQDAIGREVRLVAPARRIVTNESMLLYSLALIDPDPVARIAGWARPGRIDGGVYKAFQKKFPDIDAIAEVGSVVPENVSVEAILAVSPDLFVVSLWQQEWQDIATQLERAGVPVIFLDRPEGVRRDPAEATAFSVELLGQAIGREVQARKFATFVREKYRQVGDRLSGNSERPKVVIDVHAGAICCYTPGSDNRISHYLELAGGHNIGADMASGYDGQLNPEYVLSANPDIYIGTGSPHLGPQGGLAIGGGIDEAAARHSLADVTSRNLLANLSAVKNGRAYAVSHQLAISSLSLVVFECLAKWSHPEAMGDIDPAKTLDELNEHFLAVPLEGTFCVAADPASAMP